MTEWDDDKTWVELSMPDYKKSIQFLLQGAFPELDSNQAHDLVYDLWNNTWNLLEGV